MNEEIETLQCVLEDLNQALNTMSELEDDEAHADIYWEIKDVADDVMKRIQDVED